MVEKKNGEEVVDFGDYGHVPTRSFPAAKVTSIDEIMQNVYLQNASSCIASKEKSRHINLITDKQSVLVIGTAAGVVGGIALFRLTHRR